MMKSLYLWIFTTFVYIVPGGGAEIEIDSIGE